MRFEVAVRSNKGAREAQEDSIGVVFDGGAPIINQAVDGPCKTALIALGDGVGGQDSGEVASVTAVERFLSLPTPLGPPPSTKLDVRLAAAAASVQRACLKQDPDQVPMATTLLAVWLDAKGVIWVSVGDSPLLFIRDNRVLRLNEDHSGAPLVAKLRRLNPGGSIPNIGHVIEHALSLDPLTHRDASRAPVPLSDGDVLIIASDGLDVLSAKRIVAACGQDSAGVMAEALLEAVIALARPGQDNTTLAVVRVRA